MPANQVRHEVVSWGAADQADLTRSFATEREALEYAKDCIRQGRWDIRVYCETRELLAVIRPADACPPANPDPSVTLLE